MDNATKAERCRGAAPLGTLPWWADRFAPSTSLKIPQRPQILEMCNLIYWCVSIYIYYIQYRCILHQFAGYLHDMSCIELLVGNASPQQLCRIWREAPLGHHDRTLQCRNLMELWMTHDDSTSLWHSNTLEVPRHPQMVMDSNILKWSRRWSEVRDVMFPSHSLSAPPVAFRHRHGHEWECVTELLSRTRLWQSVSLRHIKECMLNVSLQSTEASWGDAKDCETMLDMRQVML